MRKLFDVLRKVGLSSVISKFLQKLGLLEIAYRGYERVIAMNIGSPMRQAVPEQAESLPLPPVDMIVLVTASPDIDWFLQSGRSTFEVLIDTLQRNRVRVETLEAVLEFGCGCGRVLRHWNSVHGPKIYGTDYNPRLLDWCRQNLPFARVANNDLSPPLPYGDGVFDFVYAISVFTHLSEELQMSWMRELWRTIKPGGYLIITTHGESFRKTLTRRERKAFSAGNLVVRYAEASGMNLCSAYHPEVHVRQQMSAGYVVEDFIPEEMLKAVIPQDFYLMRKIENG